MPFWIFVVIGLLVLVMLVTSSSNVDPIGGDGGAGCLPLGCFIKLGIVIIVGVALFLLYQLLQGFA